MASNSLSEVAALADSAAEQTAGVQTRRFHQRLYPSTIMYGGAT